MAIELNGTLKMRGDIGPGVTVSVYAENRTIRLVSGNELIGHWRLSEIGIRALDKGFSIRAEGDQFMLQTEDDVALAEELDLHAASPRLARLLAAKGNPNEPDAPDEIPTLISNLAPLGFALGGALLILGGFILNAEAGDPAVGQLSSGSASDGFDFWLAFVIGGVAMVAFGYLMSRRLRYARLGAVLLLLGMIVVFGLAVTAEEADAARLTAYGFAAGGLVVGVAVMSSASLRDSRDG